MLLNNPLGVFGRNVAVPGSFGINNGDRPLAADSEAVAFGAITRAIFAGDVEFFHPFFDVVPRFFAGFGWAAIGPQTDKEVARELADAKSSSHDFGRKVVGIGHVGDDSGRRGRLKRW